MDLRGRVALVTGGAGGIGRSVTKAFADAGAAGVAVNYRKSGKEAEALVADIERGGVKALAVQADVQSDDQVRAMMAKIRSHFGRLDVLVNNAGVTHWVKLADLEGLTDPIWDEILDVNLKGAFRCARAAATLLEASQGMVVNVSSISGVLAPSTISSLAYGTAKAALIYLTRGLLDPRFGGCNGAQGARQLRRTSVHRHPVDEPAPRDRLSASGCRCRSRLSAPAHRQPR
jgi:3-oxoacyl-[acyl-carrier protein] reductase